MIKITTLPNGIRLITDTQPTATSISFGTWFNVGARYEDIKYHGISHMLEHMAFKGTTTQSAFDISKKIENVGGIINAYTGKDMTAYYVRVLKENKDIGVSIIADIVQNSIMNPAELEKEKGVIIQEINMSNDTPDDLVFDYFNEAAYHNQALGRNILGSVDSVKSISSTDLLDYMHNQYVASRLIISASGDINHDDFVDMCQRQFSSIATHKMPTPEKAIYTGLEKRVIKPHEQVNLVLGFQGYTYDNPDYYTARVLASVLGGGMSSRLFQEIREKRGLVYSIYAFHAAETDTGIFGVYAGTGEHEVKELMPVLCDELVKLPHHLTDEEITRSKSQLKARLLMRKENLSTFAEANAIDMLIHNRVIDTDEIIQKINTIEKADLQRVASNILQSSPTFAALGPIEHVMPMDEIITRLKV